MQRCVGDVDRFANDHWGRSPLLIRQADRFDDLLTLDDVDALTASAPRQPLVRLVQNGTTVPGWSKTVRLGGRHVPDVADAGCVASRFAAGATVVLQSLHRTWPALRSFVEQLEHEVSHPVQANAYLTPADSAGLSRHSDEHDVIVLQLFGTKHWDVDGLGVIDLAEGASLYLPAGTAHDAWTTADASLHLTLGIIPVTYRSVVTRLLSQPDSDLDAPLPLGYAHHDADGEPPSSAHALTTGIEAATKAATRLLSDSVSEGAAAAERTRRRPWVRHDGSLASAARVNSLDLDTCVRLRTGPPPSFTVTDGRVHVDLGGRRRLHLPATALKAIEQVFTGAPLRVGDLEDLDAASCLVVARRLIIEGLLVIDRVGTRP